MMDEATFVCARLLRAGNLPRVELPDLDFPEVRDEVERRLQAVGLVLATSPYSEHVGIRLSPDATGHSAFDAASNLGLRADACALLVILWARLVLQKRTASDTREPRVRLEALVREFRPVLGGRSRIRSLVTQLRRLDFLAGQGEVIEAGPLLELGIDGERMIAFLRREVLASLLQERGRREDGVDAERDEREEIGAFAVQLLEILKKMGGSATMTDFVRETNAPASRLRVALRSLSEGGRVHRSGERRATRYHLVLPAPPGAGR